MFPNTPTAGPFGNDAIVLGADAGLPSRNITALAAVGDYLYVGAETMLYRLRVDDGSSEVLFNTTEKMSDFSMMAGNKVRNLVGPVVKGAVPPEIRGFAVSSNELNVYVVMNKDIWRLETIESSWKKIPIPFGDRMQRNSTETGKQVFFLEYDIKKRLLSPLGEFEPDSESWTTHDLSSFSFSYQLKGIAEYGTGVIAVINYYGPWQILFSQGSSIGPDSMGFEWAETAELRDGVAWRIDGEPQRKERDDWQDVLLRSRPVRVGIHPRAESSDIAKMQSNDGKLLNTLLLRHAARGSVKTLLPLLDAGANVNAVTTSRQCTPLILALSYGREDEALLLLERGADPNAADKSGTRPLAYAVLAGLPKAAHNLIERGADVSAMTRSGHTMLSFAAAGGSVDCVKLLLDNGLDINLRDRNHRRMTPLHTAAEWGNVDVIKLLVERGADIKALANRYVYYDLNPLYFADMAGTARCLIELGCDMQWKYGGKSLIEFHCDNGNSQTIDELLLAGMPVTDRDARALRDRFMRRAVEEAVARGQVVLPDD